jgi:hypothetical protein
MKELLPADITVRSNPSRIAATENGSNGAVGARSQAAVAFGLTASVLLAAERALRSRRSGPEKALQDHVVGRRSIEASIFTKKEPAR